MKDDIEIVTSNDLPPKTWYIRGKWTQKEIAELKKLVKANGYDREIMKDPNEVFGKRKKK